MTKIEKIREWIISVNASDKLINTGIILSGLSIFFIIIVENIPALYKYFGHSFLMPLFSIIFRIGLTLFMSVSILAGIWNIRRNGVNRKASFTLGGGMAMGIGLLVLLLILYYSTNLQYHSLQSLHVADNMMLKKYEKHLEKPVLINRATAWWKYQLSGSKSKYLDAEGNRQTYIPSKDDIKNREARLKEQNIIKKAMLEAELTMHQLRSIIPINAFVLIFSILIGLFMPASWIGIRLKKENI